VFESSIYIDKNSRDTGGSSNPQSGSKALARWNGNEPQNVGAVRLRAVAEKGDLHDRALWTPLARELEGAGSTSAAGPSRRGRAGDRRVQEV
jgi:hypothetical protein